MRTIELLEMAGYTIKLWSTQSKLYPLARIHHVSAEKNNYKIEGEGFTLTEAYKMLRFHIKMEIPIPEQEFIFLLR